MKFETERSDSFMNVRDRFEKALEEKRLDQAAADPDRLSFHLMPPVGWLNDPNGLYQKDNTTHIFYQFAPESAQGKSKKGWGHYSTSDYVHYVQEPTALFPDSEMDKDGAYSGSAFVGADGTVHFYYTGNQKEIGDFDYIQNGRQHWTCHFTTRDGLEFSKKDVLMKNEDYPSDLTCHVRDPHVFEQNGTYYMVQGARTRDHLGIVQLFASRDLIHWHPHARIQPESEFGYMWECPNVVQLDGQYFVILCPQGVNTQGILYENIYQNGYYPLQADFDHDQTVHGFQTLDSGFDFYAPQVFTDQQGRKIMIGWMGMPDADYDSNPQAGWQHALTIPRTLHARNGHLIQKPLEELKALRKDRHELHLDAGKPYQLDGRCFELILYPPVQEKTWTIRLRNDVELHYQDSVFSITMNSSGRGRTKRSVKIDSLDEIRIFSDTSSLEIFLNDGQETMTTRVFDSPEDTLLQSSISMKAVLWNLGGFEIAQRAQDPQSH